jgi:hypothetical protein
VKSCVTAPFLLVCALAVGCSGGETAWTPDNVEIGDTRIVDLKDSTYDISVSPLGDRYVSESNGELCVRSIGPGDDECAQLGDGRSIGPQTLAWNSDGSQILFTDDYTLRFDEPDVSIFDIESGDIEVLTDDGEDDNRLTDEDDETTVSSTLDVAPFFGPDDVVHFFRAGDIEDRWELVRLDDSGDTEAVGDIDLPRRSFVSAAPRSIGDDRWLLMVDQYDPASSELAVIDLGDESIEMIELDEQSILVDASTTHALVASARSRQQLLDDPFSLVSLNEGRDRRVKLDLDDEEIMSSAGFSPDGSAVVVAVSALGESATDRLVAMEVDDNRLGDPTVLLEADVFEKDFDDGLPAIGGVGFGGEIVWTKGGQLVVGIGFENLAVVETTAE